MIVGFNTDIKFKNEVFHIQTEDKGEKNPTVETLVYHAGEILHSRRVSYAHLKDIEDLKKRVKALMKSQHDQVIAELKGGKFVHMLPLETDPIDDLYLDDLVLDYLERENPSQ